MPKSVPLIRAMALVPAVRWLHTHGRPIEPIFREVGLSTDPASDPLRPVSLLKVGNLLRAIALADGPDVPCRIVSEANSLELALLGRVALGTRTPTEAFKRVSAALPLFCSHEQLMVSRQSEGLVLRHFYTTNFDPETAHLLLQYAVAMADRMCAMTGAGAGRLKRVELAAHPTVRLDHLEPWFGPVLEPAPGPSTLIEIPRGVADRVFLSVARDRSMQGPPPGLEPLRGDGSLTHSAKIILRSMFEDGVPTVRDLAEVCGMSVRSLQRSLSEEGTTFSTLLVSVRKALAEQRLASPKTKVASVSADLGYAGQSSLTRAMRRWTGLPPKRFKKQLQS